MWVAVCELDGELFLVFSRPVRRLLLDDVLALLVLSS